MRLIIAGDRRFRDYVKLCSAMNDLYAKGYHPNVIVSGGAKGTDTLGERWAREHHVMVARFPAEWNKYGKAAGPIRNKQMAEYAAAGNDGVLLAFLSPESKGTKHMVETARKTSGLSIIVVNILIPDEEYA